MFEALMEIMKDEITERENKAAEKATEKANEEAAETLKKNINNLMKKMDLSADEAMDILEVPLEDRKVFLVQLKK